MTRFAPLALAFSLILWTKGEGAHAAPSISVKDMVEICETGFGKSTAVGPSMSRKGMCVAYLDAVIATVTQMARIGSDGKSGTKTFCIGPEIDYDKLSDAFVTFAKANPTYYSYVAAGVMISAFGDAFPCKN